MFLSANLGVIPLRLGWKALWRMAQIEPVIDRVHKKCLPGPHWYLMMLRVEPSLQRKGIGSRLVQSKISAAQSGGLRYYLETMTEIDVAFYMKQGFDIAYEIRIPPEGIHTWMMVRKDS